MFCSVLHNLRSPQNVGMIVRAHVAFAGGPVVFVGHSVPWQFKKGSQAFSRKLERLCELIFVESDDEFFEWADRANFEPVAIEISAAAKPLPGFTFPTRTALVVGNERTGLPAEFVSRCGHVVAIPQYGAVECHNVAVSAALAMYELSRNRSDPSSIVGSKFQVR